MGREGDASRAIATLRRRFPQFGLGEMRLSQRYKHPERLARVWKFCSRRAWLSEIESLGFL